MTKILKDKIKKLPLARQQKVKARTKALIAEEMTLTNLRKALTSTEKEDCYIPGTGGGIMGRGAAGGGGGPCGR